MVPKFRCWDERLGLTEVVSIDFFRKKIKINHWEYGDSNFFPLDEVVLMQSTGLKDKNGVEIFEGDVVEWLEHRGVVEFVLNNQQTMIIGASGYITDLDYSTDFNTEVIGNIHENPKILGQANEI